MKRSLSTSNVNKDSGKSKKLKPNEEYTTPSTREYLQLALTRIAELQKQISDGVYVTDTIDDLGESDSHDDIMKEVLIKIFKELPGTSKAVTAIIDSTSKPSVAQLEAIRSKKIQLSGFEVCRKVAVNFVKNIAQLTPFETVSDERRCEANPMEFEAGKHILGSLDLHLAAKQRDYTARLMRE